MTKNPPSPEDPATAANVMVNHLPDLGSMLLIFINIVIKFNCRFVR
jgi:hypothetical protein